MKNKTRIDYLVHSKLFVIQISVHWNLQIQTMYTFLELDKVTKQIPTPIYQPKIRTSRTKKLDKH